jgi:hypothetical protein
VKSVLRKCAVAAASTVLAVTGGVATATTANANPPSGVNIRGQEEFDTDTFMDRICGDMSTEDKGFFYNTHTGEIRDPDGYEEPIFSLVPGEMKAFNPSIAPRGYHYALNPPWEFFMGNCEYPQSDTWTWHDKERPITEDTLHNCSSENASYSLRESYATSKTFTKTVGGRVSFDLLAEKLFAPGVGAITGVGADFSFSWAVSKTHSLDRIVNITVPPGKVGWISARPLKRTVRVNPVFHVTYYEWGDGQSEFGFGTKVHNWRGRGYDRIWSYGFYVDGTADVVHTDGLPAMEFVPRDKTAKC